MDKRHFNQQFIYMFGFYTVLVGGTFITPAIVALAIVKLGRYMGFSAPAALGIAGAVGFALFLVLIEAAYTIGFKQPRVK